jgi:hypothetical protein
LSLPIGIAISGSDLFIANFNTGTVGEYTTSGATVNASLISGLDTPVEIAVAPATPAIPEPSSLVLLSVGLAALAGLGFRGRKPA